MNHDDRRALVALSLIPGMGPGRIQKLVEAFGSPDSVLRMPPSRLAAIPGIGQQLARSVVEFDQFGEVDDQFEAAERFDARLITEVDDEYPPLLKEIYDPPTFLWIRGKMPPEDRRSIAIVGTRRATSYGRHVAGNLAARLADLGLTIVSGLAYGIDTAAHRGAIDVDGRSVGVLGSGIDRIYPGSNHRLAMQMLERGALLSEYPLGAAPDAPNFPRRNRIISGLSRGVIIVEAFEEGGALITAKLAIEQNREVFAVPSPISRVNGPGSGCNRLIQSGHAKLIMSEADVITEFADFVKLVANPHGSGSVEESESEPRLDGAEETLWKALEYQPIDLDAICAKSELDPSTALVHLLNLEFKGLVRQMAGKQFVRN